jgi:pantoate--beta-alanine ligase
MNDPAPAPRGFSMPADVRRWSHEVRCQGRTIAFVPTMGALHPGHLSLIDGARSLADMVVVSIFVNPLQFDERADFVGYPRPIDDDVAMCAAVGVDAVYVPTAATMYPDGFQTHVVPGALSEGLEGVTRIGHFEGVATVVTKLLNAVRPDVAVFGEKDYQQLVVIRRLVTDLDLGVDIVGWPTVREPDGLALSSRNRRLDAEQRAAAVCLPEALAAACRRAGQPGATVADVVDTARSVVLAESRADLEYIGVVDASTLEPLDHLPDDRSPGSARILGAIRLGEVRLIDNRDLFTG